MQHCHKARCSRIAFSDVNTRTFILRFENVLMLPCIPIYHWAVINRALYNDITIKLYV